MKTSDRDGQGQRRGHQEDYGKDIRSSGEVDVLTKTLEDKTHQLTNRNRGQFGTKTNYMNTNNLL